MANHLKPDFAGTLKLFARMAAFLVAVHWVPDIATWIHAHVYGETIAIDPKSYRTVLAVAYALAGIAVTMNLIGLTWAIWHDRKLKR
jgi:uncharacterized membrane protein required for colicin V production